MIFSEGLLLVERRFKATCFAALLGNHWNVVSISGCLPEEAFDGDVCQVKTQPGQRLAASDELEVLRKKVRLAPRVLIATDPTLLGEVAAEFIADLLGLENPEKLDLLEITVEGLARAIHQARPLDRKRLADYRRDRRQSQLLRIALSRDRDEVMGRSAYVPEASARALLEVIVQQDRRERIATRVRSQCTLLHFDGFIGTPIDPQRKAQLQVGTKVRARVLSCVTLAHQELAPAPLNLSSLAAIAGESLGLSVIEVYEQVYQLYLRGLINWPITTATRLDARSAQAARRYAVAKKFLADADGTHVNSRPYSSAASAITPTDFDQEGCSVPSLQSIYALIHERAVLSVLQPSMTKTRRLVVEIDTPAGAMQFEAKANQPMLHGWRTVAGTGFSPSGNEPAPFLPLLNVGDRLFAEVAQAAEPLVTTGLRVKDRAAITPSSGNVLIQIDDTIAALRHLIRNDYVRVQHGTLIPTTFGVAVAHLFATQKSEQPIMSGGNDKPKLTLVGR